MSKIDETYSDLIQYIKDNGYWYDDPKRAGIRRLEIPSTTLRHEFKDGFPAISLKDLPFKQVVTELIWFLRGDTNIKYLLDNHCNIWNKDAYNKFLTTNPEFEQSTSESDEIQMLPFEKNNIQHMNLFTGSVKLNRDKGKLGDVGPIYGKQWRDYNGEGIDQITDLINNLIEQPMATDHIVMAWNPAQTKQMGLPPCHYGFQVLVRPLSRYEREPIFKESYENFWYYTKASEMESKMDEFNIPKYGFELHWNQRSVDTFLGLPFNIASYALLAKILQNLTGYRALAIEGNLKKVHLYNNSMEAVDELLERVQSENPNPNTELLMLDEFHYLTDKEIVTDITYDQIFNELKPNMFKLENYQSYGPLKVEMLERDLNK